VCGDGGGAIITPATPFAMAACDNAHRCESRRGDADDERQFWRARNAAGDETDRLVLIELPCFAHNAEKVQPSAHEAI
jgi:hypothetical protein